MEKASAVGMTGESTVGADSRVRNTGMENLPGQTVVASKARIKNSPNPQVLIKEGTNTGLDFYRLSMTTRFIEKYGTVVNWSIRFSISEIQA